MSETTGTAVVEHRPPRNDISRHFCGQRQPHAAHAWHRPTDFGSTSPVVWLQCAGLSAPADPSQSGSGQ